MPSHSAKQHNLMELVAHDKAAAKRLGVPQSVGMEYEKADKGRKFGSGVATRVDRQVVNKPKTDHGKQALFKRGGDMKESKAMVGKEMAFMKKKGAPASMMKHEKAEMMGMKKGGMKKMAAGGMPMVMKDGKKMPAFAADGEGKMKKGGMAKKMMGGGMAYAKGGGIESKGKTKGTMIKMKSGGKMC